MFGKAWRGLVDSFQSRHPYCFRHRPYCDHLKILVHSHRHLPPYFFQTLEKRLLDYFDFWKWERKSVLSRWPTKTIIPNIVHPSCRMDCLPHGIKFRGTFSWSFSFLLHSYVRECCARIADNDFWSPLRKIGGVGSFLLGIWCFPWLNRYWKEAKVVHGKSGKNAELCLFDLP